MLFTNGEALYDDELRAVFPDTIPGEIPLSAAARDGKTERRVQDISMSRVPHEIVRQSRALEQSEKELAAEAALLLAAGREEAYDSPRWEISYQELRRQRQDVNRLFLVPWRRWATGFSCFFFVIVGAPLAVWLRNGDISTTFGKCFLPILFFYYPLLMFGNSQAKGRRPASVFGLVGQRRVGRRGRLLDVAAAEAGPLLAILRDLESLQSIHGP